MAEVSRTSPQIKQSAKTILASNSDLVLEPTPELSEGEDQIWLLAPVVWVDVGQGPATAQVLEGSESRRPPRRMLALGQRAALSIVLLRACREAGAAVALNVLVRDFNVDTDRQDDRRIEVIANGLPLLWGGA